LRHPRLIHDVIAAYHRIGIDVICALPRARAAR